MSLLRSVYYSAVLAAWAALLGVILCQATVLRSTAATAPIVVTTIVGCVIGLCIGSGLGVTAGLASGSVLGIARRLVICGLISAVGGAIGGLLGELLFSISDKLRPLGWMLLGICAGVADGIYDRSWRKIRNGMIGGAAGGLIGVIAFVALSRIAIASDFAGRAAGFVILGLSIGAMIGLVQLMFRQAWLTVVDGFGIGRQMILARNATPLGSAASTGLSFGGRFGQELAAEHAFVRAAPNGPYEVYPAPGTTGTAVNGKLITEAVPLQDGDIIRIGNNYVLFRERSKAELPADFRPVSRPTVLPADATKAPTSTVQKKPPLVVQAVEPVPPQVFPATATRNPVVRPAVVSPPPVKAASSPDSPTSVASRCPSCGQPVSGKAGLRMCKHCGEMS